MRIKSQILLGSLFISSILLTGCGHDEVMNAITITASEVGTDLSNTGSEVSDSVSSTGSSISDYFGTLFGGSDGGSE
jgi:predicted small secreted protein